MAVAQNTKPLNLPGMNDPTKTSQNFVAIQTYINQPWITYIPKLTSTGTPPNTGSTGTSFGRFKQLGKLCAIRAYIAVSGTGSSSGTGNYSVSLPVFTCQAGNTDIEQDLTLLYYSGTNYYMGMCRVLANTNVTDSIHLSTPAGMVLLSASDFGLASGAFISIQGTYECQ